MTSSHDRTPSAPGSRLRLLVTLVILTAATLGWWALSTPDAGSRARAEQAATTTPSGGLGATPPQGFGADGLALSAGTGGPEVTIYTDLTCPYCQDFFGGNAEQLRELVDGGSHDVTLVLTQARATSATNETAITRFVTLVGEPGTDPLTAYLTLSSALVGAADDADQAGVMQTLSTALADAGLPTGGGTQLPVEAWGWLTGRTADMRATVGVVPSVTVDDRQVTTEELRQMTGLPFE